MINTSGFSQFEDNKLVLQASQLLEELKRLTALTTPPSIQHDGENIFLQHKLSTSDFKHLVLLRTRMKQLLLQRFSLVLKAAYSKAVEESESLFKECWLVTESEKVKLRNLPVLGYSPYPGGHFFDLVSCKMFPEKLIQKDQQWCGIEKNFQRAVSLFHTGFSYDLAHIFYCTLVRSSYLLGQLLFLVSSYLNVCLEKLCCIDPGGISSEFVASMLETCDNFNDFCYKSKKKCHKFKCCCCFCVGSVEVQVDWRHLLSLLASFQSCIAANRIVCTLVPNTQKKIKESNKIFKMNWLSDEAVCNREQVTSDYATASCSDTDVFYDVSFTTLGSQEAFFDEVDSAFLSVFQSVVQKNQTLLLKYVFAVKNSNHGKSSDKKGSGKQKSEISENGSQKVWGVSHSSVDDQGCSLERSYWISFWKKTEASVHRMLVEVPIHHYGDILPGSMIIWSENFLVALMKILRSSCEAEDISPEGQKCLKNTLFFIFTFVSLRTWDASFCSATKYSSISQCTPVPTAGGNLGTKPGLFFCSAIKPLLAIVLFFSRNGAKLIDLLKATYGLVSTVDTFQKWVLTKERALLSSWNVSTYLIIAYSDVVCARNVMSSPVLAELVEHISGRVSSYMAPLVSVPLIHLQNTSEEMKGMN